MGSKHKQSQIRREINRERKNRNGIAQSDLDLPEAIVAQT